MTFGAVMKLYERKRPKLREVYLPAITTFAAMIKNKDYGSN